jgi:hypothetical protein
LLHFGEHHPHYHQHVSVRAELGRVFQRVLRLLRGEPR